MMDTEDLMYLFRIHTEFGDYPKVVLPLSTAQEISHEIHKRDARIKHLTKELSLSHEIQQRDERIAQLTRELEALKQKESS